MDICVSAFLDVSKITIPDAHMRTGNDADQDKE